MMIDFFTNLPMSGKIIWIILAAIFLISVIRAVVTKGKSGGIGAGIVGGLAASIFLDAVRPPWYIMIPAVIAVFAASAGLLTWSQMLVEKKKMRLFAVLVKILSIAGFTIIGFRIITSIGNGGMIAF